MVTQIEIIIIAGRENPDGEFGPATERAVKAFQGAFGIEQSGAVGALTYNRLYSEYKRLSSGEQR